MELLAHTHTLHARGACEPCHAHARTQVTAATCPDLWRPAHVLFDSRRRRLALAARAASGPPQRPPPPPPPPLPPQPAARLGAALARARAESRCLLVPACYDGLSSKLIVAGGGFEAAFFSGFGASAARLGMPDAGIITYSEMEDGGRACCSVASSLDPGFPIIGDGDTGFGAVQNIRRAVRGYASAGFAAISIEDQTFPKRCAFSKGMRAVGRDDAVKRVRAALEAARAVYESTGQELLIVGRTDVRNDESYADAFGEAMWRCAAFEDLGCDVVYFEGPQSEQEMRQLNQSVTCAHTMLAQVEKPGRRLLSGPEAASLGYSICLHGITLLSASVRAMESVLDELRDGRPPRSRSEGGALLSDFDHLYSMVGFDDLNELEAQSERPLDAD